MRNFWLVMALLVAASVGATAGTVFGGQVANVRIAHGMQVKDPDCFKTQTNHCDPPQPPCKKCDWGGGEDPNGDGCGCGAK